MVGEVVTNMNLSDWAAVVLLGFVMRFGADLYDVVFTLGRILWDTMRAAWQVRSRNT